MYNLYSAFSLTSQMRCVLVRREKKSFIKPAKNSHCSAELRGRLAESSRQSEGGVWWVHEVVKRTCDQDLAVWLSCNDSGRVIHTHTHTHTHSVTLSPSCTRPKSGDALLLLWQDWRRTGGASLTDSVRLYTLTEREMSTPPTLRWSIAFLFFTFPIDPRSVPPIRLPSQTLNCSMFFYVLVLRYPF